MYSIRKKEAWALVTRMVRISIQQGKVIDWEQEYKGKLRGSRASGTVTGLGGPLIKESWVGLMTYTYLLMEEACVKSDKQIRRAAKGSSPRRPVRLIRAGHFKHCFK